MDPTKLSLSSKAPHVNNGGGNESPMEETSVQRRDSVDGENRVPDVVDVTATAAAAEINLHHRGSADKHKFNTLGYQRRTKQKVVTDFATVTKGASAGAKPRAALRQVLFSQGASDKNPASEGQLDVLKQDLEAYAVPVSLKWKWKEESQGTTLEKNWTDIVHSHSTMSKIQRHQQEALWEFVHTELTYINKLIIIRDLVIAALVNLHQRGFLPEVTPELLFSNLPSILTAHQLFWQEVIYPMLQEVRSTGMPFDPMRLEAGCLQFQERFSSYKHYCWEEEYNLEFTRRQMESNPHFLTYIQWVETHPQCERMRLGDMQAKPHQRITKYPLLLKAVLKTTQDPHVQHALRGMLSSMNTFLDSINDYLKLKDEELALSISAQRVERYEVEGINEEIDKHVREICQFDLTCPITGVGPGVVRKLLLEENLKIRGRKDSKLEVVALLFSDVLLMTKVHKKGERLKVVRPPLALDRTNCIPLKDSSLFVLVEVGELQCAMNVYIFTASTSESCSTWVSTINQAKETLRNLRETERTRQLHNWKIQQLEVKPVIEAKTVDMETISESITESGEREAFVDEFTDELIIPQSINRMLASKETEEQYQSVEADKVATHTGLSFWQSQPEINHSKVLRKGFGQKQTVRGYEWIEMRAREEQGGIHIEKEEKMVGKELWVTSNQRAQSAPNLDDHFISSAAADPFQQSTTGPYAFLMGEYPDIDYPINKPNTLHLPRPTVTSRARPDFLRLPGDRAIPTSRDSDSQSINQDTRRNSSYVQSRDTDTFPEVWGFSKNLKSPRLRRRRPVSTHQDPFTQVSRQLLQDSGQVSNNNLSSNSDSDYNQNMKKNSEQRVLKLGSLKPNQGMFWNVHDDPQTLSEPELPDLNTHNKKLKLKTQRSASIPNIIIQDGQGFYLPSSNQHTLPQTEDTISEHNPNGHPSPLEGLLERAKDRVRDREVLKRDRNVKMANLRSRYPPSSPSFSTTPSPSPSPSDGDRDTDWEEEVELLRHRALTVSKGWKEQLVDGDDDDKRNSVVFTNGVNVDWPGWCFDDDEVMDRLQPGSEGLLEDISRSLPFWDIHGFSEQEDGECSQV